MFSKEDANRLENKVDKIVEDIHEIKIVMTKNTVSLEEHIKRTNLLEEEVDRVKEDVTPVKEHVLVMKHLGQIAYTSIKITTAIVAAIGTVLTIVKLLF